MSRRIGEKDGGRAKVGRSRKKRKRRNKVGRISRKRWRTRLDDE